MRGLLRKEFYITLKNYKYVLFIIAVYIAVMLASLDGMPKYHFSFYSGMFLGMIPTGIYITDEQSRWTSYSLTLPYSRAALASSKYVCSLIFGGTIAAVYAAIEAARVAVRGESSPGSVALIGALVFASSVLPTAISLPFMYALGSARGRIAYLVVIGAMVASMTSFFMVGSLVSDDAAELPTIAGAEAATALAVFAATAAVFAASWAIAILCYKRRSF